MSNETDIIDLDNIAPTAPKTATFDISEVFETDEDAEEQGKWFLDVFANLGFHGVDIKLRRATSKKASAVRQKLDQVFAHRADKAGKYPEDIVTQIGHQWLAQAIVVDWRGVNDGGQPLECTPPNILRVMRSVKSNALALLLIAMSFDMSNFRKAGKEEIAGN
jgi:hypothetical protein